MCGPSQSPYAPGSFSLGISAMSIWGKLASATAELARGGPIGGLHSSVGHQEPNGSAETRWRSPLA